MATAFKIERTLIGMMLAAAVVAAVASASPAPVTRIRLPGGGRPGSVLSAYGSIWVASHEGVGVYRIDPRTNRVITWIKVGENQCVDLSAGAGVIWVWNCSGETGYGIAYEIDARTNRVIGRISGMYGMYGAGSLWTQSQDWKELWRVDPRSHVVLARIKLPIPLPADGHVFPAAICAGSLWSVADTAVIRYDVATNTVASVIQLPNATSDSRPSGGWFSPTYAACAAGKVWVPNLAGLYSIDAQTNTATRLPIPIKPNSRVGDPGVTASGSQVFVRTSDTTVTQVDGSSGRVVRRYPAGGGGGEQIAVAFGSVWIPAASAGSVWRDPIPSP
jgi:hypothetical protein